MHGLYIHIPFCVSKCSYCDFYSIALESDRRHRHREHPQPDFMAALEKELESLPPGFQPHTVFLGGGTPTELSDHDFAALFDMLARHIDLTKVIEWTCESNPGTLTESKIELMQSNGVDRVSLGVQTFDAKTLDFLGRIHTPDEAVEGFEKLRTAGYDNVNLDIIYGTPGAPADQHRSDVERIVALAPEHTSFYCLMYEEGTTLTKLKQAGRVHPLSDDRLRDQHDDIRERLLAANYEQYELSNFARPEKACLHNLLYWNGDDYLGCGPAAHSHWEGKRFSNVRNIKKYCDAMLGNASPRDFEEELAPEPKARELLVTNLRKVAGMSRADFEKRTGFGLSDLYEGEIERFVALGFIEAVDESIRLTDEGLFVSDAIFAELV